MIKQLLLGRKNSQVSSQVDESGRVWVIRDSNGQKRARCYAAYRLRNLNSRSEENYALPNKLNALKLRSLVRALLRSKVPATYVVNIRPGKDESLKVYSLLLTWVDVNGEPLDACIAKIEEQGRILATAVSVAYPDLIVKRVEGKELRELANSLWLRELQNYELEISYEDATGLLDLEGASREALESIPEFYVPDKEKTVVSGIRLGKVMVNGAPYSELRIEVEDVSRHVCLLGMTGTGKTTTAKLIVRELAERGIPVLVLDVHNEYYKLARRLGGVVLDPGRGEFSLNPLDASSSVELAEHVSIITDIFSEIYKFTPPQAFVFRNSVTRLLLSIKDRQPLLQDLVAAIESLPVRSMYDNETKLALLRRLLPLTEGQAGKMFNAPTSVPINELLNTLTVIELGYIRDSETRSIFSSLLLKLIYDYAVRERQSKQGLAHVTVVEEARYLVPYRRPESPPAITEKMISELRKFGEGIILVSQFPSQLSLDVVKNSAVKIVHRVAWADDLRMLKSSMGLSEEQAFYMSRLDVGEAIVLSPSLGRPVLARIEAEEIFRLEGIPTAKTKLS